MGRLLTCKQLAWEMDCNVTYVYAMRKAGFQMPGNRTTLKEAVDW